MNEPTVEPPPVELPDEPSDKPPCTKLVFHFDINPVDFYHHTDTNYYGFCPGTSAYLDTSLDNLGLGNTYKNFRTDPGNGLGITATFKPKPNAERGAGGIDSSIDQNLDTTLYDDLDINNSSNFTTNNCADIGLGKEYYKALVKWYTQTTPS